MKRARLETGRVRVVPPASHPPIPASADQLLKCAFDIGRKEAIRFVVSRDIQKERFEKELAWLSTQDENHQGLRHLARALLYCGLHVGIEGLKHQQMRISHATLRNVAFSGAAMQRELLLAHLHLTQKENAALFRLVIPGLLNSWWNQQCGGTLTVARLTYFLLGEGLQVFCPTPSEDIDWKVDLIARIPGTSTSICFQVKSSQLVELIDFKVHHVPPAQSANKKTHRFFSGVRRFQEQIHGNYVPVEITFGAMHFADGNVVARRIIKRSLHEMLAAVTQDDPHTAEFVLKKLA